MAGSTVEDALAERLLALPPSNYAPWRDRGPALALIEREGLPNPRSESWRHTNIRRWYEAAGDCGAFIKAPNNPETDFVSAADGICVEGFDNAGVATLLAEHDSLTSNATMTPLAAMNALLLGAGVVIRAQGSPATPVRIGASPAEFQHLLIVVDPGATVTVIEEPAPYIHRIVQAVVAAGGVLSHWRRQAESDARECSMVDRKSVV